MKLVAWPASRSSTPHLRRILGGRRRYYRDSSLQWAETNPETAQQSLQPPGWNVPADVNDQSPIYSIEDYLKFREWRLPSKNDGRENALSLISHVLSTPLTIASFYNRALHELDAPIRLCCVGARAEATLPNEYWKEFLIFSSSLPNNETKNVDLMTDFVGPDICPRTPDTEISWNSSTTKLHWHYKGFLHDLDESETWDTYVLMNPGIGHDKLKHGWKPTLDRILRSGRPVLLTAHSEKDSDRDTALLKQSYHLDVHYEENPFASRVQYEDPFDQNHFVRPNHFMTMIK
ncbi:unnamed protein product [Cylindrotheca closterium]|uniref:Mitochondrial splicing suppressor 51-like C-terminal domain-containing protein n=1 Tax=Cylindrotheca closterium TaxID=2856 RepID=A0AAD2G9U9_9STRA|nr:unnamed protein product [Cylindrotheca closterium]